MISAENLGGNELDTPTKTDLWRRVYRSPLFFVHLRSRSFSSGSGFLGTHRDERHALSQHEKLAKEVQPILETALVKSYKAAGFPDQVWMFGSIFEPNDLMTLRAFQRQCFCLSDDFANLQYPMKITGQFSVLSRSIPRKSPTGLKQGPPLVIQVSSQGW